MVGVASAM